VETANDCGLTDRSDYELLEGTGLTFRKRDALTYAREVAISSETVEVTAGARYSAETTMIATKTLAPLLDVPQAVTVETQQLIADQQMQSMADSVRDDLQYFRDWYNVERVEVLKRPNAMIFGRGGAGGVITRATRTA
jgi:catecholate siderophore receptor